MSVKTRKKLIEVALPLEAINVASAREKSIRHGHPSTLHLWWARRPLAAARAVIFAQMVDDPSAWPERFPTEEAQDAERERLFRIIEQLVLWENTTNEDVLDQARAEIRRSWQATCEDNKDHPRSHELFDPKQLPAFHDPFAGGGALPLEAQRLGLESWASDLNPVAVLINKAMIEIPPKFAGQSPVNRDARERLSQVGSWKGAEGLADDMRYYGKWVRDHVLGSIGHLYPRAQLPTGGDASVIAWIWARTVTCPNPACGISTPLVRAFKLATKPGKEAAVRVIVDEGSNAVKFEVTSNLDSVRGPTVDRNGARCVRCGGLVPLDYVASEGRSGRLVPQLMATVALGNRSRIYLSPSAEQEEAAGRAIPENPPVTSLPDQALGFRVQRYGMTHHADLFTARQLRALECFADAVGEVGAVIADDARESGRTHAAEYAAAVQTYIGLTASKLAAYNSMLCSWLPGPKYEVVANVFTRQAVSMTWDFAEANPFAGSSGDFFELVKRGSQVLSLAVPAIPITGHAIQADARTASFATSPVVATDPPYYDNIGYADLSDFFYTWIRRSLAGTWPDLMSTVMTPKTSELIANAFAFAGDRQRAEEYFEDGMKAVFTGIANRDLRDQPVAVFYAFKQAEDLGSDGASSSTGWETMLEGLHSSGFAITGTWPIRTERSARPRGQQSNALASSIVLVCRARHGDAPIATRRELASALKAELPAALRDLQRSNIAPVDLAQSAIGPGMAIYTRYAKVLDADSSRLSVRDALALINQTLDEVLAEQEGDFDADTRWAVSWFDQIGFAEGDFGLAETLSKAKNTSVDGMVDAGIVVSGRGKVRLLRPEELPADWDPVRDIRLTVWEATHHLVRALDEGEQAAADLARRLGGVGDAARELAYRLYMLCERKKRAQEALAYNALVQSWPEIQRLAADTSSAPVQGTLEV